MTIQPIEYDRPVSACAKHNLRGLGHTVAVFLGGLEGLVKTAIASGAGGGTA
ncbi:MAG: hypothetical protein AAGN66_21585 [Acidobacteriota bacterium]